jgi:hypothetical protein
MSFMSNNVIHVKSWHSCQIMSFMSWVIGLFRKFTKVGRKGWGGVKYVFLGLRRQLCCLAEGKNAPKMLYMWFNYSLVLLQMCSKHVSETCSKNASGLIQLCSRYASDVLENTHYWPVITCLMKFKNKKCSKNASGMIQLCSRHASDVLENTHSWPVITCLMKSKNRNCFNYDPEML